MTREDPKRNTGPMPLDLTAKPQTRTAGFELLPRRGTFGGGDLRVPSVVPNDQTPTASGDLSAGGFAGPPTLDRQPKVRL